MMPAPQTQDVIKCSYLLEFENVRLKLQRLRDESILTDVTLVCNGTKIPAHRCILAVNSQYFRNILCSNDTAKQQLVLVPSIIDVSEHSKNANQVKTVIDFMYTGSIEISEYNVVEFLNLSIVYLCHDLLEYCSDFIKKSVTDRNCISLYLNLTCLQTGTMPTTVGKQIDVLRSHLHSTVKVKINNMYFNLREFGTLTTGDIKHLLATGIGECISVEAAMKFAMEWLYDHLDNSGVEACMQFLNTALSHAGDLDCDDGDMERSVLGLREQLFSMLWGSSVSMDNQTAIQKKVGNIISRLRHEEIEEEVVEEIEEDKLLDVKEPVAVSPLANDEATPANDAVNDAADYSDSDDTVDLDYPANDWDNWGTDTKSEVADVKNNDVMSWAITANTSADGTGNSPIPSLHITSTLTRQRKKFEAQSEHEMLENQSQTKSSKKHVKIEVPASSTGTDIATTPDTVRVKTESEGTTDDNRKWACDICHNAFKKNWHLNRHIKSKHTKVVNDCVVCQKKFSRKDHIKRHMNRLHLKDAPYKCSECSVIVETVGGIVDHMDEHYNPQSQTIRKVKDKTQTKPPKNSQWIVEEGKPKLSCLLCDKIFNFKENLKQHHLRMHSLDRPFHCATCERTFGMKHDLKNHMMRHSGKRPYACENCGKTFFNKSSHGWHYKMCSGQEPPRKHTCEFCGQNFRKVSNLKRHLLNHSDEKPHSCTKCNMTFKHPTNLKMHMKVHTVQIRRFICKVCNRGFYNNRCLKQHMFIHEGVRPYACQYCGRTFTQKATLTIHIRSHEDPNDYRCKTCSKKFTSRTQVTQHYNVVHLGERSFQCKMCSKTFGYKHELDRHILAHNTLKIDDV